MDLYPEMEVKIGNLVNEINDFAVGILRAEIKSSEERIGCRRLLQQVHNGNVEKLPSPEGILTMVRGELAIQVRCQRVKRTHRPLSMCYEFFPVQLNLSHENPERELFLEPISRVLKKNSKQLPCVAAMHGFHADDDRFYHTSPSLAAVEKPSESILEPKLQMDTSRDKGLYSKQQLWQLNSMLGWPELKQQSEVSNPHHVLSQPIWDPEVEHEGGGVGQETSWWSLDNLFALASQWKYLLAASLLPSSVGVASCLARAVGLTTGCKTDARMGGVGIVSTLASLLCHSYLQGRKQAEERRKAISEVYLKMVFLQQVDAEAKEMRKGKNEIIKVEAKDRERGEADQESLKEERKPEDESKRKNLF